MRPAALGGSSRYSPSMKVEFGTGLANQASSESVKNPRMSLRARQPSDGAEAGTERDGGARIVDEGRDASVAGLRHEEQRAALEALRETVERLPGVSEMMHLTPRLSPSMPSPSASIDGVLPEELRLPPSQRVGGVGGGGGSLSSTGGGGGMAGGAAATQRTVLVVPKA